MRDDGQIEVAVGLAWIEDNLDPARRNKGGAPAAPSANRLRPAYHGILTKRGHAEHEGDDLHQPNRPMD